MVTGNWTVYCLQHPSSWELEGCETTNNGIVCIGTRRSVHTSVVITIFIATQEPNMLCVHGTLTDKSDV